MNQTPLDQLSTALETVTPPKQDGANRSAPFRYYAGFSERFVEGLLPAADRDSAQTILDPWMGSGTTIRVARGRGCHAVGIDLNPAMAVIARARLLSDSQTSAATRALKQLLDSPRARTRVLADPLLQWFEPATAETLRDLSLRAAPSLSSVGSRSDLEKAIDSLEIIEAHLLASLFLVVRGLLTPFMGSNPMWVRLGNGNGDRRSSSWQSIRQALDSAADDLRADAVDDAAHASSTRLCVASSKSLPDTAKSATHVVTSPPYCTRIDYVVASRPELAVLGVSWELQDELRRETLGTTTVPRSIEVDSAVIGEGAAATVRAVAIHEAKASATYYRKWVTQYFADLAASLDQLCDLQQLKAMVLVVQDSHYKEMRIDLASVVEEMCDMRGWGCVARRDFPVARTKASIHPGSRKYRDSFHAVESVLVLGKSPTKMGATT